jgi:hypothetical protein
MQGDNRDAWNFDRLLTYLELTDCSLIRFCRFIIRLAIGHLLQDMASSSWSEEEEEIQEVNAEANSEQQQDGAVEPDVIVTAHSEVQFLMCESTYSARNLYDIQILSKLNSSKS